MIALQQALNQYDAAAVDDDGVEEGSLLEQVDQQLRKMTAKSTIELTLVQERLLALEEKFTLIEMSRNRVQTLQSEQISDKLEHVSSSLKRDVDAQREARLANESAVRQDLQTTLSRLQDCIQHLRQLDIQQGALRQQSDQLWSTVNRIEHQSSARAEDIANNKKYPCPVCAQNWNLL